jgi:hypothetical protein
MLIRDIEERVADAADAIDDELNDPLHTVMPAGSRPAHRLGVGIYLVSSPAEGPQASGLSRSAPTGPKDSKRRRRAATRRHPR